MKGDTREPDSARPALGTAGEVARLGLICVVVLFAVRAFVYVGGWLSPGRTTQGRIVAAFEVADGSHPGFRRARAKGVCATGWFDSNGNAASLSKAALFAAGRVPVVGQLAFASGMPSWTMSRRRCAA
jgi:catalase